MHGVSLRKPCERCHPSERPASTLDQLAVQPAATMSGPERIFIFEDGFVGTWPSSASPWLEWTHIDRKTHEAVVRELAAAREKLESVTVVKDGMIRVAKELSDEVERLRALLDGADHSDWCDSVRWKDHGEGPERHDSGKPCNCYRSRIPRAKPEPEPEPIRSTYRERTPEEIYG